VDRLCLEPGTLREAFGGEAVGAHSDSDGLREEVLEDRINQRRPLSGFGRAPASSALISAVLLLERGYWSTVSVRGFTQGNTQVGPSSC